MRGLAVAAVVLYHLEVPGFGGGYLGVDVFLVLSGFVIARRLAATDATGPVGAGIVDFYARRARRILPVAALVVLTTLVWTRLAWPAPLLPALRADAVASITATLNLRAAAAGARYGQPVLGPFGAVASPFAHFWSLAVEEQFYLLVAPVALVVLARWRRAVRPVVWIALVVSVACWVGLVQRGLPSWAFYLLVPRAWELLLGIALVPIVRLAQRSVDRRLLTAGGAVGLLVLLVALRHWSAVQQASLAPHAAAAGSAALLVVAAAGAPGGVAARMLGRAPLVGLGDVAYPLYLWHVPVSMGVSSVWPGGPLLGRGLVAASVATALAAVTHVVLEQPLRHLPALVARPAASIAAGVALVAVVVVLALLLTTSAGAPPRGPHAWSAEVRPTVSKLLEDRTPVLSGCDSPTPAALRPADCATTLPGARPLVVVVGDSHAHQWFPAVRGAATAAGHSSALFWRPACPWFDPVDPGDDAGCDGWRSEVLETLGRLRPAVVVLAGFDRALVRDLGADEYRRAALATDARLPRTSTRVVLADGPVPPTDARVCLVHNVRDVRRCAFARDGQVDRPSRAVVADVARRTGAVLVDTVPVVCPRPRCDAIRDRTVVFRDADHLTLEFSASRAAEMARLLAPVLAPR